MARALSLLRRRCWPCDLFLGTLFVLSTLATQAGAQTNLGPLELEGHIGSRPAWARFWVTGTELKLWVRYASPAPERSLSGGVAASLPSAGRLSVGVNEVEQPSGQLLGSIDGIWDFSRLEGEVDVAFEGRSIGPRGAVEPARFVSARSLALAELAHFRAVLPVLAPPSQLAQTPNCAGRPSVQGVVRWGSFTLVLHALRFDCPPVGESGSPLQTLALALSAFREGGGPPRLLRSLPAVVPFADAADIVEWSARMTPFPLARGVLGLAIAATATISGSGLISETLGQIVAIDAKGAPVALLSYDAGGFGKSRMDEYSSSESELYRVGPSGAVSALLIVTKHSVQVDGDKEQSSGVLPEAYRFIPSRVVLERQRGPVAAAAWRRARIIGEAPLVVTVPIEP